MRTNRVRFGGLAVVLAAALVLAACGDDDDDDDVGSGSAAPAPTGPAIELGLVNTEASPAGNFVDSRKGYEAAVKYVNEELGGVNGRPLELESCPTNGSPETSLACANNFVQSDKTAVLTGVDLGASAAIPILTEAGIPYVGGLFVSAEEYAAPTGFSFTGGAPAALAGIAAYTGQELKAKKVVMLTFDVPQAQEIFDAFVQPVLTKVGVTESELVRESPAAPDFTPAMTRAASGDTDAIIMSLAGTTCVKAMQAAQQLNVPAEKLVFTQECANEEYIEAGGTSGVGAIYQTAFVSPDSDEPNAVLFREKLAKYTDAPAGGGTETSFDTILNLYEVMKTMDSNNITKETLLAALQATNNETAFLSHGFTCNRMVFPAFPALCDTNVRILKYENGEFGETNNQWIDGMALLTGN